VHSAAGVGVAVVLAGGDEGSATSSGDRVARDGDRCTPAAGVGVAVVLARAKPAAPSQKNVIDLMAILKKSLQVEQPDAKRSKRVQE
jgi:hypothetical protein